MILQSGNNFLDIADADCASGRGLEGGTTSEIEIVGVFEIYPFLVGEKVAERTVSICNLFPSALPNATRKSNLQFRKDTCFEQRKYPQLSNQSL